MGKVRVRPLFLVLSCLTMLLVQALSVNGGSEFRQSGEDFGSGTMDGVLLDNKTVVLERGNSSLGNWTEMMAGYPAARISPNLVYDSRNGVLALSGGLGESFSALSDCLWLYNMTRNRWFPIISCGTQPSSGKGMMAYDSWHGVFVLCGSYGIFTFNVSTNEWKKTSPVKSPPLRSYSAIVFDERNGVIVLFGGEGSSKYFNDTWTYNITSDAWTEMRPATAPSPRGSMLMAFDKAAGVTVLHSGNIGFGDYGDTWLYNASNNTWSKALSSGGPGCNYNTMAYDDAERLEVVFIDGSSSFMTYNLSANLWTSVDSPSKPPVYKGRGMGYDIANGAIVITGGFTRKANDDVVLYDDVWNYDLSRNAWKQMVKAKEVPSARFEHAMVYDESGAKAVMFGGDNSSSMRYQLGDTWMYDVTTNTWSQQNPVNSPHARRSHGMVYCPGPNVTVLFGGNTYSAPGHFNDTWTYDLSTDTWKDMRPSNAPPSQDHPGMAFDESHGVVVLLTTELATWTYNVSTNTWKDMAPTTCPTKRDEYGLVYDSAHDTIVAILGRQYSINPSRTWNYTDVWTYDLDTNTWTNQSPTSSPLWRSYYSVVYDSQRNETVMFGGIHDYFDGNTWQGSDDGLLWRYNLTTNNWTSEALPIGLEMRGVTPIVYINATRSMLTFGGNYDPTRSYMDDTWAYNIVAFTPEGTYVSPEHDTGGTSYFGTIDWTADTSPDTYLGLQLRTSDTRENLTSTSFLGPDGTNTSFYVTSGAWISHAHNASRWLQFRAYLASWDPLGTPVLREVSIEYNRLQTLDLTSPQGGENWTGVHDITWNASDPDNDTMAFDILLVNGTGTWTLASNLTNGTTSWSWEIPHALYGFFYITVVAHDSNQMIPLSARATSGLFALNDHTPMIELVSPQDAAEVNLTEVDLVWNATDEDGDLLDCYVFLSNSSFSISDLPAFLTVVRGGAYHATGLFDGTTYYWTVLASDRHMNSTVPAVRSFTVRLPPPPNHPPVVMLLLPVDGAVLQAEPVALSWNGTDPDGDVLRYSIMLLPAPFNLTDPPAPFAQTNATTFDLSGLMDGRTYYWTVLATDGESTALASEVRHFTFSVPRPNHPPTVTLVSPLNGAEVANTSVELRWAGGDEDGDSIHYYLFLLDFPFTMAFPPMPYNVTDDTTFPLNDLVNGTTYYWAVLPNDGKENGTVPVIWSFSVRLPSPPPPPVNHAPRISGPAHVVITAGEVLKVKFNATDEDGDRLLFSLQTPGYGITLDGSTGDLEWQTGSADVGDHTISINVTDGRGGRDSLSMVIEVIAPLPPPPVRRPVCSISTPWNGSRFWSGEQGMMNITGTAKNGSYPLVRVEVRIDGGRWLNASATERWWLSLAIRGLKDGNHTIEARSFDGTNYSDTVSTGIQVSPSKHKAGSPFPLIPVLILILIIATMIAIALILRKSKG